MSRFTQALAVLLPTGFAWPREASSTWMRLLTGLAGSFEEHNQVVQQAATEWLPHATHTRLDEWEEATGLPDPCFGPTQPYAARQARLLARLRGPERAYADSSSAALGSIEIVAANMGIDATAHHITRFRCGRDRVGRRVGEPDGKLYVVAPSDSTPFRVGGSRVQDRLAERPSSEIEMACALEQYVPARFELVVVYI